MQRLPAHERTARPFNHFQCLSLLHEVVAVEVFQDLLLGLAGHLRVHTHQVVFDSHDLRRFHLFSSNIVREIKQARVRE